MTTICMEGVIEIELADVYVWLEKAGYTKGVEIKSLHFSVREQALMLVRADGQPDIVVDGPDFWIWVGQRNEAAGLSGFELVFGVPHVPEDRQYSLVITFAGSNTSDPRTWDAVPECLLEWQ